MLNTSRTGVLFIGLMLTLILTQCSDNPTKNTQVETPSIQEHFSKQAFSNVIPFEFEVEWNNGHNGYSKKMESSYYEFPVKNTIKYDHNQVKDREESFVMYRILAVPNQSSYDFFALKYMSNQQYTTSLSWKNRKGFTGHLYKINPEEHTLSAQKFHNGNLVGKINFLSKEEYEHISDSSGSKLRMSVTCYTEVTHHYTDWYREYSDGSIEYIDTTYEGATFNEVCHETGSSDTGSGGGSTGGDETYYDYTDKLEINGFFNDYGNLFTVQEENFVRDNPWLVPYLEQYIENGGQDFNPDWPDFGLLGNFFRDMVFDTPEEAIFFARYVNGNGDWKISQTMFEDIVTDAEEHDSNANKNYDSQHGSYKRVFNLNGTNSKYELGLGTFTVYYDSNDNPIGLYDEYNWDFHVARYIDYPGPYDREIWRGRTILGISDRTFINEWKTRGMNGISNFLGEAKSYKIYYP